MTSTYLISGSVGSPYTRKMLSILRYRRIPYHFLWHNGPEAAALPAPPLPLQPCIWMPDAEGAPVATSDSSFQLRTLEERFAERSVIPCDPALAFLDYLVEDYADEWVTKMMFHYRWGHEENIEHASQILPLWNIGIDDATVDYFRENFTKRQVDRLSGVVTGSLEVCGPIIEATYRRLLGILTERFRRSRFVSGDRPGAGDFGLQGQLTQLVQVEPTSMALARERSVRVMGWVDAVDDLSGLGVEGDAGWAAREDLDDSYRALFAEIGRTYAPFLVANAAAIDGGAEETHCEIDGSKYWQKAFPYQRKCLRWIQDEYATLGEGDRAFVDATLAGTGCEVLVA